MKSYPVLLMVCSIFLSMLIDSRGGNVIAFNQEIRDSTHTTIVSAQQVYEMGFFSPQDSEFRYVGIWYKMSTDTVVWVANRITPLNDSLGVLKFDEERNLVLLNSTNDIVWSTNLPKGVQNPVAQLLDSGNLVIKEASDDQHLLWRSFDHIGNTLLPDMKLGKDLVTGLERSLVSWNQHNDPFPGEYTVRLDTDGYPQILLQEGSNVSFRSGPWNGLRFSGMPNLKPNPIFTYNFVMNEHEIYYQYERVSTSFPRMMLSPDGSFPLFAWSGRSANWNIYWTTQMDLCDQFARCGAFGSCNINDSPTCECLPGFKPKLLEDWETGDRSAGCIRKSALKCGKGDGFQKVEGVKLPDTRTSWYDATMELKDCEGLCSMNCSCTAYANLDIRGTGCLLWFGDLIDIRYYSENGQDIYIKLAASDIELTSKQKRQMVMGIVIPIVVVTIFIGIVPAKCYFNNKAKQQEKRQRQLSRRVLVLRNQETDSNCSYDNESTREYDLELPLFEFDIIANATNDFAEYNKIGEGGYGPVYKGTLLDGQEIAVKRLSKTSRQGVQEFKNEVKCIAKLQHRNLVKLLGCCISVDEQILVSFDILEVTLIADQRSQLLDWPTRFNIINGIARGLLYLHQDSRLRIVHRDLKASNVLLDHEMNPKISDFGLARSFGGNETEGNTKRVVGTYGYMPPEYAIDGIFSIKSDVFSFGVLILEIITGRRNRGFFHPDHKHNLLGHAWMLHKDEKSLELLDDTITSSCNESEVSRSVHVGVLCVQESPEDRPSMATVVTMLSSEMSLPDPKQPGFFTARRGTNTDSSSNKHESHSINELSITSPIAR